MKKISKQPNPKLKFYPTEQVKILPIKRTLKGHRYAVTNYGRAIRFSTVPDEGEFMKQFCISADYPCVYIHNNGKRMNALVHRLVAQNFLPKPSKAQVFVIHVDRNNKNNHASNLRWANKTEHLAHAMGSKNWRNSYSSRAKLTEDRVRMLKKKMKEGKTSFRHLAKQFGVTDMQLYRIKWGENWGWVK